MAASNITLTTTSFLKGNYSSSREFSILQDNKNTYAVYFIMSVVASLLLNYVFNNIVTGQWMSSFYVTIGLIFGALVIVSIFFTVKKETVLLVVPIAMQLSTTYLSGRQTVESVPWYLIDNLMILDVIVGQQVLFFLAVEIKNKESKFNHIILFPRTRPRIKHLERIYREFQEILDQSR